ncbi:hypothetical protein [Pseudomonas sp. SO81]|uniref:hypothetical protein n=1 Tax=Pseudomonas sp. SO81 TaxID=2983246 RepID=UPI0025A47061|nr:hypothetical protein [Pseudomonas sp. SO81]
MEIPESNNVYGLLTCPESLEEPARVLRQTLALGSDDVVVKKSQFDGAQSLVFSAAQADFKAYGATEEGEYLFNGAVAGTAEEVCLFVQELHSALTQAGYRIRFEVYDAQQNCIAEFHA